MVAEPGSGGDTPGATSSGALSTPVGITKPVMQRAMAEAARLGDGLHVPTAYPMAAGLGPTLTPPEIIPMPQPGDVRFYRF